MILLSIIIGAQVAKNKTAFMLVSSAFNHNDLIPAKYTCDGENISPELSWQNPPKGTKSFALIVDDPDAPAKVWVHWIVCNMPSSVTHLAEGEHTDNFVTGNNDFKTQVYGGPCPPSGMHRYQFTLYALDSMLNVQNGINKQTLLDAMQDHILGSVTLVGTYQRKK
jgi:hypothetical protein